MIDYFSKYMGSFPVIDNNSKKALFSIKEFCINIGFPKIQQTDNGAEYCNEIIDTFYSENTIKHITSSLRYPQTNGVIEIVQREIRRKVMMDYSNSTTFFDLKNSLLEEVNIHNHNIHTSTSYRPIDIINNIDDEIYLQVMENIKKNLN